MNHFFHNKVVVVTGGSAGIGKALVAHLLRLGASVATCGRNKEALDSLQSEFSNADLFCVVADIEKAEDCSYFIAQTIAHYRAVDILINNAGISMKGDFADTDTNVIRKVMDINFMGTVYCTKAALSSIMDRKGTIVGISSIAGYRGLPGRSGYSASKFAMNGWLEALRTELLETGVNVMWVSPGFTKSNIRNEALMDGQKKQGASPLNEEKLMTAEECAGQILHAIVKRKRTLVMTFQGKRTVFLNKFFPSLADKLARKFFYKNGKLIR